MLSVHTIFQGADLQDANDLCRYLRHMLWEITVACARVSKHSGIILWPGTICVICDLRTFSAWVFVCDTHLLHIPGMSLPPICTTGRSSPVQRCAALAYTVMNHNCSINSCTQLRIGMASFASFRFSPYIWSHTSTYCCSRSFFDDLDSKQQYVLTVVPALMCTC